MASSPPSTVLHGVPISQPVRAVLFAAAYKGLALELKHTMPGRKGPKGTKSLEFAAINSWGATVPALTESSGDGSIWSLSESGAILTYLADKHGWEDLYPVEHHARAVVDRYLHWHHRNTREITIWLFAPAVRADMPVLPAAVHAGRKAVAGVFATIERNLVAAGTGFLCSGITGPTLADFACYAEVGQCGPDFGALWDFSELPATRAWMARMEALPGFEATHASLRKFAPRLREMVSAYDAAMGSKL